MCSLKKLGLSYNKLSGQFSQVIQNLSCGCVENSLEVLYLQYNDFTGPLPLLGGFSSLEVLELDVNFLNGTIDKSLSQLSKLESLSLVGNSFTGVISETFFSNMSNLQELYLGYNSLTLKLSHNWVPPFQLKWFGLASCKMGPHFPKWLQTQNQLVYLDISNVGISDTIPDWFWDLSSKLSYLNLSNNHIKGKLPDLSLRFDGTRIGGTSIDINSNHFEGSIPPLPSNSPFLNLSKNKFSGFSGKIPDSMGFLNNIRVLNLHNNRLTGELPSSLRNFSQLRVLDVGKNAFFGEIPTWIGESLQNLIVLSLKSNKFHGNIPSQLCHLGFIQVLDLSLNIISGNIPKCFNNFSAMTYERCSNPTIGFAKLIFVPPGTGLYYAYLVNLLLTWKGNENEYKRKIPLGTQLQSFNASVYAGNLELCGLPLANKCPDEESTPSPGTDDDSDTLEDEDDQLITLGFYVSSILGFFVGFWGVCGTLMLNRPWRHGYFNFLTGYLWDGILPLLFRVVVGSYDSGSLVLKCEGRDRTLQEFVLTVFELRLLREMTTIRHTPVGDIIFQIATNLQGLKVKWAR
ncbi:hypothetical protein CUMW_278340 [Citrus unshiu]|uniref:Leucine-rich repeat-containing N-terminal plant-type domain-containing protein n=1 Tax=Citrus unshiu TaxID=55188 RepID=A0A2H5N541_CITUN|nr:hypothetical protein CUMW_278340 [Citrus unshiu]